ncbi:MAG TPA: 3D domain-containing protein [Luteolibacter sp.]|nr:3D domain-containing protein [Luteolibacter sp.]
MISKLLSISLIALSATLLSNCSSSGPQVLAKSDIRSGSSASRSGIFSFGQSSVSFPVSAPSAKVLAQAASKPKDRHKMPVYAFSDRNRVVRTTAYTCSEDDHIVYGSNNATGTQLRYSDRVRSAAADWSFYPVGTVFKIAGLPYTYVVDDYGSALTGTGTIDIYKPTKDVMNAWGRRNVEITVLQWGSFTRSAEILSQRTKYSHCSQMLANIVRQRPDLGSVVKR